MSKKTKLTEKATRIPEIRQKTWDDSITRYLLEVDLLNKEQARSHRFTALLQELLEVEPNFIRPFA